MRLRDGRQLAAMPGAEAIGLVRAVAAARAQELLPGLPGAQDVVEVGRE